jgi:multiple sugar transport system permease protein
MNKQTSVTVRPSKGSREKVTFRSKPTGKATSVLVSRILRLLQPYLYVLPAMLCVGFWLYRPLLQTVQLSFYEWNLLPTTPKKFVGMLNYERIVNLPDMHTAISNSLIYMIGILPFSLVIPLVIAIGTERFNGRAKNVYRMLVFFPMIMAPVVASIIWNWMLHPLNGIVNQALKSGFHLSDPIRFLSDERFAIWTILLITGWKMIGFSTLIFSAALTGISKDYYEAAMIDRASRWQIVRYITLPLLSPFLIFILMLSILFSSEWSFAYINVLTQGGPSNSTINIYYLLWNYGFKSFSIGWGSASAVLFFVVFGFIAWLLTKLSNRYSFYDE